MRHLDLSCCHQANALTEGLGGLTGHRRYSCSSALKVFSPYRTAIVAVSSVLPIEFADHIRFNRAALKSSASPCVISSRREGEPKAVSNF